MALISIFSSIMATIFIVFCVLLFRFSFGDNATWISSMNPIKMSNSTLINLLNTGGYAILSAGHNPKLSSNELLLTDEIIQERLGNLSTDLTNIYLYSDVLGMYDESLENSFLVVLHNDSPDKERTAICKLGEKYNQDSVIYVKQASPVIQQLIYTTGPLNGTYVEGQGYQIFSGNVTDNYSSVRLCPNSVLTFSLNFDFEHMFTSCHTKTRTEQLIQHHARNRARNRRLRGSNT